MTPNLPQSTMMSILHGVLDEDAQTRHQQLERFADRYTAPFVYFLVQKGAPLAEAEETVQDFWLKRLVNPAPGRHIVANFLDSKGSRAKGAFRAYLATSIFRHFIDRTRQLRRLPASLDALQGLDVPTPADVKSFDVVWANSILRRCVDSVHAECRAKDQLVMWHVFCEHILKPNLLGKASPGYAELAKAVGLEKIKQAGTLIRTVIRKFQSHLAQIVADYLPVADDENREARIEEESNELLALLGKAGSLDSTMFRDFLVSASASTSPVSYGSESSSQTMQPSHSTSFFANPNQGLYRSEADFSLRWQEMLHTGIAEWLTSHDAGLPGHCPLVLSEVVAEKPIAIEWLSRMRNTAKRLALESQVEPAELLACVYSIAIATAYLQHHQMLTSDLPSVLVSRVTQLCDYVWLDSGTRHLFARFLKALQEE